MEPEWAKELLNDYFKEISLPAKRKSASDPIVQQKRTYLRVCPRAISLRHDSQNSPPGTFHSLNRKILLLMFDFLGVNDLVHCSQTCVHFYKFIATSPMLRKIQDARINYLTKIARIEQSPPCIFDIHKEGLCDILVQLDHTIQARCEKTSSTFLSLITPACWRKFIPTRIIDGNFVCHVNTVTVELPSSDSVPWRNIYRLGRTLEKHLQILPCPFCHKHMKSSIKVLSPSGEEDVPLFIQECNACHFYCAIPLIKCPRCGESEAYEWAAYDVCCCVDMPVMCSECSIGASCPRCRRDLCERCLKSCRICDTTFCSQCMQHCDQCGAICRECLVEHVCPNEEEDVPSYRLHASVDLIRNDEDNDFADEHDSPDEKYDDE
eukprot:TRINITY_DN2510_c0_g1_i1.p1 TRINITY_DN2510_c0_g1~~TRINITY_DN2510_c0_g1_i1.p1  ORF type:complete len:392 (-),score=42.92 TRINITY_DN2510_c0_g1_i1:27-1163(-)